MRYLLFILSFCLLSITVMATHNRAGEISYVHAPVPGQDFRFEFTITTYSNTLGGDVADRDSLEVFWGDQQSSTLARLNGPDADPNNGVPDGESLGNGVKKNVYTAIHVYPGFAPFYVISMTDPNRNEGIINIGSSVEVEFYIEDTLFLPNPQFLGYNSSPILSLPPIDFAELGQVFIHNPTAFDPDGDSLHFQLIPPLQAQGLSVPNYQYPDEVSPGFNNTIALNSSTGEFVWDAPQEAGEYNIAFLITEYRSGIKMGTMIRDMQIFVEDTGNTPPEIEPMEELCVRLGEEINLTFVATDDDIPPQVVRLSAFGAPFELETSPATWTANNASGQAELIFSWQTVCDHVFSDKYTVVIKAEDNFVYVNTPLPLTDLETWQITVVAPPPQGVMTNTDGGEITISWNEPYECATMDKFIGFAVWRALGCDNTVFDECKRGLDGTPYTKIASNITDYEYTDESAVKGLQYSYRVVAEFADANNTQGFPINISESHPSPNACATLPKDAPIITHVTVLETDENMGKIFIDWTKPVAEVLDTIINAGPYTYEIYRSDDRDGMNFSQIAMFNSPTFAGLTDTSFTDENLNTTDNIYSYKIVFLANDDDVVDETAVASSVFIKVTASSNELLLSWDENVPWINQEYHIYRRDSGAGTFDSIGTTTEQQYLDQELINGFSYCYYITSEGTYFTPGIVDPIFNDSQIDCGVPIDTVPPCPPIVEVSNACEDAEDNEEFDSNLVFWESPESICGDGDVITYLLYYTDPVSMTPQVLDTINDPNETEYEHFLDNTLAGCYYVIAIDSFLNVSKPSNEFCVESCLIYELPNAFTPNNDTQNDLYTPLEGYRFVNRVDFKVFNRWGDLVFETEDPALNWDGTDFKTNKELPAAVYYYVCKVYEKTFSGGEVLQKELDGAIHLFRDGN